MQTPNINSKFSLALAQQYAEKRNIVEINPFGTTPVPDEEDVATSSLNGTKDSFRSMMSEEDRINLSKSIKESMLDVATVMGEVLPNDFVVDDDLIDEVIIASMMNGGDDE